MAAMSAMQRFGEKGRMRKKGGGETGKRDREKEREREKECVYVCVNVNAWGMCVELCAHFKEVFHPKKNIQKKRGEKNQKKNPRQLSNHLH